MRIHGRVSAVGAAIAQDSNVDRPVFGPATFKDVGFDTSVLFGGKAGIFFDTPVLVGNVGLELEVYQEPASRAPVP